MGSARDDSDVPDVSAPTASRRVKSSSIDVFVDVSTAPSGMPSGNSPAKNGGTAPPPVAIG